mmetsp:Transcript_129717/g.242583  ORF Transcript_129717/g.242583 Transcript_129717/m.242583 type:complete len:2182 (+) Transcript_129717:180-6725(+)
MRRILLLLVASSFSPKRNPSFAWSLRPQGESSSIDSRRSDLRHVEVRVGGHLISQGNASAGAAMDSEAEKNGDLAAVSQPEQEEVASQTEQEQAASAQVKPSPGQDDTASSQGEASPGPEDAAPVREVAAPMQEGSGIECNPNDIKTPRSKITPALTEWLNKYWMKKLRDVPEGKLVDVKEHKNWITDTDTVILTFQETNSSVHHSKPFWKQGESALLVGLYAREEEDEDEVNIQQYDSSDNDVKIIALSTDEALEKEKPKAVNVAGADHPDAYVILLNCPRRWLIVTDEETKETMIQERSVPKGDPSVKNFLQGYEAGSLGKIWKVPGREDLENRYVRFEKLPLDDDFQILAQGDNAYATMKYGNTYETFSIPMWQTVPIDVDAEIRNGANKDELDELKGAPAFTAEGVQPPFINANTFPKGLPKKERVNAAELQSLLKDVEELNTTAANAKDSANTSAGTIDSLFNDINTITTKVEQDVATITLNNNTAADLARQAKELADAADQYSTQSQDAAKAAAENAGEYAEKPPCQDKVQAATTANNSVVQAIAAAHEAAKLAGEKAKDANDAAEKFYAAQTALNAAKMEIANAKGLADAAKRSASNFAGEAAAMANRVKATTPLAEAEITEIKTDMERIVAEAEAQKNFAEANLTQARTQMEKLKEAQNNASQFKEAADAAAKAAQEALTKTQEAAKSAESARDDAGKAAKEAKLCKDEQEAAKLAEEIGKLSNDAEEEVKELDKPIADGGVNGAEELAQASARNATEVELVVAELGQIYESGVKETNEAEKHLKPAQDAATEAGQAEREACSTHVAASKEAADNVSYIVKSAREDISEFQTKVKAFTETLNEVSALNLQVQAAKDTIVQCKAAAEGANKKAIAAIEQAQEAAEKAKAKPELAETLAEQAEQAAALATERGKEAKANATKAKTEVEGLKTAAQKVGELSQEAAAFLENEAKPFENKMKEATAEAKRQKDGAISLSDKALACMARIQTEEAAKAASVSAEDAGKDAGEIAELLTQAKQAMDEAKEVGTEANQNLAIATKCKNNATKLSDEAQQLLAGPPTAQEIQEETARSMAAGPVPCCADEAQNVAKKVLELAEAKEKAVASSGNAMTAQNAVKTACDKLPTPLQELEDSLNSLTTWNSEAQAANTSAKSHDATAQTNKEQAQDGDKKADQVNLLKNAAEEARDQNQALQEQVADLLKKAKEDCDFAVVKKLEVAKIKQETEAATKDAKNNETAAADAAAAAKAAATAVEEAKKKAEDAKKAAEEAAKTKVPNLKGGDPPRDITDQDIKDSVIKVQDWTGNWVRLKPLDALEVKLDGVDFFLDFDGIPEDRKENILFKACKDDNGNLCGDGKADPVKHKYRLVIKDTALPGTDHKPWKLYKWKGFFGITAKQLQKASIDVVFQGDKYNKKLETPEGQREVNPTDTHVSFTPSFESAEPTLPKITFKVAPQWTDTIEGSSTNGKRWEIKVTPKATEDGSSPAMEGEQAHEEQPDDAYKFDLIMPAEYWCVDWPSARDLYMTDILVLGHKEDKRTSLVSHDSRSLYWLVQNGKPNIEKAFDRNGCKLTYTIKMNYFSNPRQHWSLRFPIVNPKDLKIDATTGRNFSGYKESATGACSTTPIAQLTYFPKVGLTGARANSGLGASFGNCAQVQCGDLYLPGWWYGPIADDLAFAKEIVVTGDKPGEKATIERTGSWSASPDQDVMSFKFKLNFSGMVGEPQLVSFPIKTAEFINDNDCMDPKDPEFHYKPIKSSDGKYELIVKPGTWYSEDIPKTELIRSMTIKLPPLLWSAPTSNTPSSSSGGDSGNCGDWLTDYRQGARVLFEDDQGRPDDRDRTGTRMTSIQWCFLTPDQKLLPVHCSADPTGADRGRENTDCTPRGVCATSNCCITCKKFSVPGLSLDQENLVWVMTKSASGRDHDKVTPDAVVNSGWRKDMKLYWQLRAKTSAGQAKEPYSANAVIITENEDIGDLMKKHQAKTVEQPVAPQPTQDERPVLRGYCGMPQDYKPKVGTIEPPGSDDDWRKNKDSLVMVDRVTSEQIEKAAWCYLGPRGVLHYIPCGDGGPSVKDFGIKTSEVHCDHFKPCRPGFPRCLLDNCCSGETEPDLPAKDAQDSKKGWPTWTVERHGMGGLYVNTSIEYSSKEYPDLYMSVRAKKDGESERFSVIVRPWGRNWPAR